MRKSQIIYGTQTANAQEVAEKLKEGIEKAGLEVECMDMFDGDPEGLSECADVYFVVSTWGEGEPPDDSLSYFNGIKGFPDGCLKGLRFAVCGLGDSGYDIFNGFGKNLESELIRLGATAITARVDCDIDFEELSDPWIEVMIEHDKSIRESSSGN